MSDASTTPPPANQTAAPPPPAGSTVGLPTVFCDGVLEAHVRQGVARVTLGQTGPDGRPMPSTLLVLPLAQLPGFVGGMARLMQEIEARAKQQAATASGGGGAAAANGAASPVGGAVGDAPPEAGFRFGTD